jgi:hypothetical protein
MIIFQSKGCYRNSYDLIVEKPFVRGGIMKNKKRKIQNNMEIINKMINLFTAF